MLFHLKVTVHQICDFVLSLWEKNQVGLNFFWPVYALNFQLIACCMLDSGKRDHQPSGPLVLLSRNMTKPTKSPVCTAKAVINLGIHAVRSVFAVCLQWKLSFTWQPIGLILFQVKNLIQTFLSTSISDQIDCESLYYGLLNFSWFTPNHLENDFLWEETSFPSYLSWNLLIWFPYVSIVNGAKLPQCDYC